MISYRKTYFVLCSLFVGTFAKELKCHGGNSTSDEGCQKAVCLPGWSGEECNIAQCKERCHKTNGYCTQPGECKCALGWRGENCDECVPLPGCKNGFCNTSSYECICKPGWEGTYCSIPICREECHPSRGYCKVPDECRCRIGWGGATCDVCRPLPGCKNGICTKPLECKCREGWTGVLCDKPICKDRCSKEHGSCSRPGECRCNVGWWGKNCETCFPYPGCKHGDCEKPWECNCEPGWKGMTCDEKIQPETSYCHSHENPCKNGGTCVDYGRKKYICACSSFFTGEHCDFFTESRPYYFPILPRGSSRTIATPLTSVNDPAFQEALQQEQEEEELESVTEIEPDVSTGRPLPITESSPHVEFDPTFRLARIPRITNPPKPETTTTTEPISTTVPTTTTTTTEATPTTRKTQQFQDTSSSQVIAKQLIQSVPRRRIPATPSTESRREEKRSKPRTKVTIRKKIAPVLFLELRDPTKPFVASSEIRSDIRNTDANSPQANQIKARFLRHHDSVGPPPHDRRSFSTYKVPSFVHEQQEPPRPSRLRMSSQVVHGPSPVIWEPLTLEGSNIQSVVPAQLTGTARQFNVGQKRSIYIPRIRPVHPNQSLRGFSSRENYETVEASETSAPRNVREPKNNNLYHIQNYNGRVHIGDTTEVDKNAPLQEILEAFIELKKLKR